MATENTGYKGYSTLLKVANDGNNSPLDINNNLCSESGLPQATKSNTIGDPDYIAPVYDIVTCPTLDTEITPTSYSYDGHYGTMVCAGGGASFVEENVWVLYSDMTPLGFGIYVYDNISLTTLSTITGFKEGNTIYEITNGLITSVTTVGNTCLEFN